MATNYEIDSGDDMPQSRQADTPVVSTDSDKRSVQRTPFLG